MLAILSYDVVLWVHITAVVTAFGPLFAYPLFLAHNARGRLASAPASTDCRSRSPSV